MRKLTWKLAGMLRYAARLLPPGQRDWAAAVWAEAHEVPPGLARLAWRAGGVWVLAREALLPRRPGRGPPIRGCQDRRPTQSWRWPGSC